MILKYNTYEKSTAETAIFAGGCFWCMHAIFKEIFGVLEVISGYSGGVTNKPDYEQVSNGNTLHRETVKITFNPKLINYEQLLKIFFDNINPTDKYGQFSDRGFEYTTAIFYLDENQKNIVENYIENIQKYFSNDIATKVIAFTKFYPAEKYHQNYFLKNPMKYLIYKKLSGRENYFSFKIQEKPLYNIQKNTVHA